MNTSKFRSFMDAGWSRAERTYEAVSDIVLPDQTENLIRRAEEVSNLIKGVAKTADRGNAEYRAAVGDCVALWKELTPLRERYQKADLTLSAYYQSGKLLDYLEGLVRFAAAESKPTDTAEKLAVKGYSNYLFVIRKTWEGLQEKHTAFAPSREEDRAPIRNFLMSECRENPFYGSWFQLRSDILTLRKKGGQLSRRECAGFYEALEMTEYSLKHQLSALTRFLREKHSAMQDRAGRLEAEAEKGEALYAALESLLTQELFDRMDPDGDVMEQLTMEQVREEYKALAEKIENTLLTKYVRE